MDSVPNIVTDAMIDCIDQYGIGTPDCEKCAKQVRQAAMETVDWLAGGDSSLPSLFHTFTKNRLRECAKASSTEDPQLGCQNQLVVEFYQAFTRTQHVTPAEEMCHPL